MGDRSSDDFGRRLTAGLGVNIGVTAFRDSGAGTSADGNNSVGGSGEQKSIDHRIHASSIKADSSGSKVKKKKKNKN